MEKIDTSKFVNKNADSLSIVDELLMDDEVVEKLASLGVSKEEIPNYASVIYRYKVSKDQCRNCKGLDKCQADSYHNSTDLAIGDAGEVICKFGPCKKQALKDVVVDGYLDRSFPDEWLESPISNSVRVRKAMTSLKKAVASKDKKWAYLVGDTGTGKSFIIASFCNKLAEKGAKICFVDTNKKFGDLRLLSMDKFKRTSFDAEMNKLQTVKILVLDNFGSEFKSEYVINTVLRPIINERAKNKLFTFFTSNYSLNDVAVMYGTSPQSKLEISTIISTIKKNIESETIIEDGIENYL